MDKRSFNYDEAFEKLKAGKPITGRDGMNKGHPAERTQARALNSGIIFSTQLRQQAKEN